MMGLHIALMKPADALDHAAGITSIGCHNLSPGMVLTDLLLEDASPVARRFFNALAEEPETVAAALVPQIRAVQVCALPRRLASTMPPCAACRAMPWTWNIPQDLASLTLASALDGIMRVSELHYQAVTSAYLLVMLR